MAEPSVLNEFAAAAGEYAALLRDPVYDGRALPRGDDLHVLVLPGLFGNDFYLTPLRGWLLRLGYRPIRSSLAVNAGCPDRLSAEIDKELARSLPPGADLAIIGHSRGGILAWALASRLGSRVTKLVLVGSPAGPLAQALRTGNLTAEIQRGVSRIVVDAGTAIRRAMDPNCAFPACDCSFLRALRAGLVPATRVVSIASEDDQIVPARLCQVAGAENIVVSGTHSGLMTNAAVYRELARVLAASR